MEITRKNFEELKTLPYFKGKIVSGSMIPVIKIGDVVTVEIGVTDLNRFDIIVFWEDGRLMCHYLWSQNKLLTPMLWQTRGLQGDFDFPLDPQHYLGRVTSHRLWFWHKLKLALRTIFSPSRQQE